MLPTPSQNEFRDALGIDLPEGLNPALREHLTEIMGEDDGMVQSYGLANMLADEKGQLVMVCNAVKNVFNSVLNGFQFKLDMATQRNIEEAGGGRQVIAADIVQLYLKEITSLRNALDKDPIPEGTAERIRFLGSVAYALNIEPLSQQVTPAERTQSFLPRKERRKLR